MRTILLVILPGFTSQLIAQPVINSFTPLNGGPGVVVTLKGTNFQGATAVSFGGVVATSYTVVADSVITARVSGGGASGAVKVVSSQGSDSLPGFFFSTMVPVITGVFPYTGPISSVVTIKGGNFDPLPANDTVYFGGVRAYVSSANANYLTVSVPVGAVYAPISVTSKGLTVYSNAFIPVYTGGGSVDSNSFAKPDSFSVGKYPLTLTTADFDGDGRSDLAAVTGDTNQVAVLRNSGFSGTINFLNPVLFGVGSGPSGVATADFNGDGKPDLAVTNKNANTVSVLRNTSVPGTIAFSPKVDFATGGLPLSIATADLDGDGRVDLVTVDSGVDSVSIFRNSTLTSDTISFSTRIDIAAGGGPRGIALGDLDGDGRADMVICDPAANQFIVFRNTSAPDTISFAAGVVYPAGSYPISVSIADLDGDGKPELIIGNSSGNNVSVFRNVSIPGTIILAPPVTISNGSGPAAISISDVNGDGKPDITLAAASSNAASVLQNVSTAGNIAFSPLVLFPAGNGPEGIVAGDFDGDGKPDIALANYGDSSSTSLSVLRNLSMPRYPSVNSFAPSSGKQGDTITISGVHFAGTTAVSFGHVPAASFVVVSDSVIRAVLGSGASGLVAVTTAYGSTNRGGFRYIYPLPVISSFSPDSATTGDTVTVRGSYFMGADTLLFGDVRAKSFTVLSDSVVIAIVGSGASGFVRLTTAGGTDSSAGFVYVTAAPPVKPPSPVLMAFGPASAGSGDSVVIAGRGLDSIRAVLFGGVPAQSFKVFGDSVIIAVVGSGATGDIVATFNGGADTLVGFTWVAPVPPVPPVPPVFQLLGFTGVSQNGHSLLQWRAADDSSIAYYVVQYSSDSVSFDAIGSVKAKGADSAGYSFTDPTQSAGVNYYRLKIEDTGGKVTLSPIVRVALPVVPELVMIFPNPASEMITAAVPVTTNNSGFELVDMMGHIVVTVPVKAGVTQVTIYVRMLNRGVYKLMWSDGVNKAFGELLIIRR